MSEFYGDNLIEKSKRNAILSCFIFSVKAVYWPQDHMMVMPEYGVQMVSENFNLIYRVSDF